MDYFSNNVGKEAGDPAKGSTNIIAFVTTRKELPLRFVLGDDAFATLKAFYTQQLADMEETKELSTGTNYPTA